MLQETLLELVGVGISIRLAWAYAADGALLDVDQATSLLVMAVLAGRLVVRAARECWAVHREGQPPRAFPPDRYIGVFQYLLNCFYFLRYRIKTHTTLPCSTKMRE